MRGDLTQKIAEAKRGLIGKELYVFGVEPADIVGMPMRIDTIEETGSDNAYFLQEREEDENDPSDKGEVTVSVTVNSDDELLRLYKGKTIIRENGTILKLLSSK